MTRTDFQRIARLRLSEAKRLLAAGHQEGAYYLTGLAVECALKAAIARKTQRHDFPPTPIAVKNIYVHDLNKLLSAAGLESNLDAAVISNPGLKTNWAVVKDWT